MANKRYDQFAAGTYSTSKIFLQADPVTGQLEKVFLPARGVWGEITGTLSAQTDLATALAGKEPTITAGTTLQYWRGDKSFQTLNTAAVPESGNLYYTDSRARASISLTTTGTSGAATYSSTTGILNVPNYASGGTTLQYWRGDSTFQTLNTAAVPESGNLYYTDARARSSISLTTTGTSGAATYNSGTGVLNVPNYAVSGTPWNITGNASTVAATNFIGTTDSIGFTLRTNNVIRWQWPATSVNASIYTPTSVVDVPFITAYRRNSTTQPAIAIGVTSGDDSYIDTANGDVFFRRSGAAVMTVNGLAGNSLLTTGAYFATLTTPAGTTLKWGVIIGSTGGANRLNFGIDSATNAVMQLGNTNLRVFNSSSTNDLMFLSDLGSLTLEVKSSVITTTACAKLCLTTTSQGLLFPRMTTTQKNAISSPVNGLVVYDTTLAKLCVYTTAWEVITSI